MRDIQQHCVPRGFCTHLLVILLTHLFIQQGQIADDATQDIGGQTRQVLAAIDALLARAGTDKTKILMVQIYLADIKDFTLMNEVWDNWVSQGNTPPRATVQATLANPDWKIEIVATAAIL